MAGSILEALRPVEKPKVMDLVRDAGLDVSDWAAYDGIPAANPRFCYEWCFEQEGLFVFNIWYENTKAQGEEIFQSLNLRKVADEAAEPRKRRAKRFDDAARKAYEIRSPVRVLILDRPKPDQGATARLLDKAPWFVSDYEYGSGDFIIRRGIHSLSLPVMPETQESIYVEGQLVAGLVRHRRREAGLREKKIEEHRQKHGGRLICEVAGCGFDFEHTYGKLGEGYAQVHHLIPLASLDVEGEKASTKNLAVVCANCHAMIHRYGECRELDSLLPERG